MDFTNGNKIPAFVRMGVERDDRTKGMRVLICNHPKTRRKGDSLCLLLQKAKLIREQKLKMCFGFGNQMEEEDLEGLEVNSRSFSTCAFKTC